MTLQDIAADIQRRIGTETNSAKVEVFGVIANLVAFLQAGDTDSKDATIAKLQAELAAKDSLLDNDAITFLAIKVALGNPDLTQGQLANEIMTKWRRI